MPADERRSDRVRWPLAISLALLMWFALGALHVLFEPGGWWFKPATAIALVFVVTGLTRMARPWRFVPTLAGLGALIASVTFFFGGKTAILQVVPLPETVGVWVELGRDAGKSIVEQAVPAEATNSIVFVLAVAGGAAALLADALAYPLRVPALSAIPAVAMLAVPVVVLPGGFDPVFFVLAAGAYLLVLYAHRRSRHPAPAVAIGAVSVAVALMLPGALPPGNAFAGSGSSASTQIGVNPIIDLGEDLRRPEPLHAFSYTTTASEPLYFKVTTFETFTDRWHPVSTQERPENSVDAIGPPFGLSPQVQRAEVVTEVKIGSRLTGRWLPVPYPPVSVSGLAGAWFWEPSGLSIRTEPSTVRGQTYEVTSLELQPTAEQLRASGTRVPDGLDYLIALDEPFPPIIEKTAFEVAGDEPTNYDKALALQEFLANGDFTYSEFAPVDDGFNGAQIGVLGEFLEEKEGYCVHFASAMAIMARYLGIPSRLAAGFQPGVEVHEPGEPDRFEVTTHDLHAWPELYFEGVGWVRFEPTPGRGDLPDYEANIAAPADDVLGGAIAPVPTQRAEDRLPGQLSIAGDIISARDFWRVVQTIAYIAGALALAAALASVPFAWRRLRRKRRLARIRSGRDAESAAWSEVVDTATDLGFGPLHGSSARQFTGRLLRLMTADARAALERLRDAVEASSYAREPAAPVTEADVLLILTGLAEAAEQSDRRKALLLPRSLAPKRAAESDGIVFTS